MAIAFDASSENERTDTSDPWTWTHTPVGTPRGVVVLITKGATSTGRVSTVTYGGVSMSFVGSASDLAGEAGRTDCYFLGAALPTGAQTVSVDLTSATTEDIHGVAFTVTSSTNTEIIDFALLEEDVANPTVTLRKAGRSAIGFASLYSGSDATGGSLAAGLTLGPTMDQGSFISQTCYETTASTSDIVIGWSTLASDDTALFGVAIAETTVFHPITTYSWDGGQAATAASATLNDATNLYEGAMYLVTLHLTGTSDPTIVPPTGWTQVGNTIVNATGGGTITAMYYRFLSGSGVALTDKTWTWTGNREMIFSNNIFFGVDPNDPIASVATSVTAAAAAVSITSATASGKAMLVLAGTEGLVTHRSMSGGFQPASNNAVVSLGGRTLYREVTSGEARTYSASFSGSQNTSYLIVGFKPLPTTNTGGMCDFFGTGTASATSVSATFPAYGTNRTERSGYQKDDFVVMDVIATGTTAPSFSTPSGWTKIGSESNNASGTGVNQAQYYRILDGSELNGSATITWTTSRAASVRLSIYRGVNPSSPLDTAVTHAATGTGGSVISVTAAGASQQANEIFHVGMGTDSTPTPSTPTDGFCQGSARAQGTAVKVYAPYDIASAVRTASPSITLSATANWTAQVAGLRIASAYTGIAQQEYTLGIATEGTFISGWSLTVLPEDSTLTLASEADDSTLTLTTLGEQELF